MSGQEPGRDFAQDHICLDHQRQAVRFQLLFKEVSDV